MDVVGGDHRYCLLLDMVQPCRDGMRRLEGQTWIFVALPHGCKSCTRSGKANISFLPVRVNSRSIVDRTFPFFDVNG